MSDKDYFGDNWVSDSEDFGDSQIEYPEDLLDESFGVDEEAVSEGVLGAVSESEKSSDFALPKRPKIAPQSVPSEPEIASVLEDNLSVSATPEKPISNDSILDAILSGRDDLSLSSPVSDGEISEEKNYEKMVAEILAEEEVAIPAKTPNFVKGVSQDANFEVAGKDLIDIIAAGLDETSLDIDIDYDPDEDESDEFDVPLATSLDEEEVDDYEDEEEESDEDSGGMGYEVSDSNLASANKKLVKSRRRRRPGPKKKRGPKPGLRLTARDVQILTFLARYRVATVGQLARAFQTSETALRNRLPRLEKEKLVSWAWGAQSKPKLWLITRQGLQVTNMTLTVPTVKWGQLRHTLGLTDLGIEFELAGELVITEREIRAAATRYSPTSRIRTAIDLMSVIEEIEAEDIESRTQRNLIVPMQGRALGHIPDMILAREAYPNGDSGNIAIELELNRKNTAEWVLVLTAYRDSPLFEKVIYYTMNKEIKRALTAIAKAINAEDKIEVQFFVPVDNTADPLITGGK